MLLKIHLPSLDLVEYVVEVIQYKHIYISNLVLYIDLQKYGIQNTCNNSQVHELLNVPIVFKITVYSPILYK